MPTDAPTWDDTTEAPTWEETQPSGKLLDLSNIDIPQGKAGAPKTREALAAQQLGDVTEPFKPIIPLGPDIQADTLGGQLLAAPYNVGKGLLEGMESPGGLALLPFGAAGKLAQSALGAGFGIPAVVQGAKDVYSGTALGERQKAIQGAAQALAGSLITGGAVKGALAKEAPVITEPPIIPPPKISEVTPSEAPPSVVAGEVPQQAPSADSANVAGVAAPSTEPAIRTTTVENPVSQAEISGVQMGAAGLEEALPTGTGLKNAVGEMERVGLGLEDAPEKTQRNMAGAWEKSAQVEAAAPGTGKALADSLIADPERGLTDADSALLLRHKTDTWNKLNDAAERTHKGNEAARSVAQTEYDGLLSHYNDLLDAVNKRGSEWGREGRWRQAMAQEDFTFSSTDDMNRYRRTLTGEDMPGEKVPKATRIAKDVKEAQTESDAATNEVGKELKVQASPPTPKEAAARVVLDDQAKAAQRALDAANKTVRDAAARMAEAESKARVATTVREREAARVQVAAERRAVAAADKIYKGAAADLARKQRALQGDPIRAVWSKVKEVMDKGENNPDQIRAKVANELGISADRVYRIMAQNAKTKRLLDDAWYKQQKVAAIRQNAKAWVRNLDTPAYEKAISNIPKILFGLKVGFHGTVALGTHAPTVAFQPRFWSVYTRDFGKMYKMVADPRYYERQVQDLVRRPNFIKAKRGGLVNDPKVYEDFTSPDTAKYFGRLTGMGNRGYTVLKILRQDMFDQMYNQLPRSLQVQDSVVAALADQINHATGVVKGHAPLGTNLALFAPRLEAARFMQVLGDPAKAAWKSIQWNSLNAGEKLFIQNQLKEKLWILGTFFSLLAANQGFLSAIDSKQKINGIPQSLGGAGFDPMESDFLKFKVAGHDVAYGSAIVNMMKLPVRAGTSLAYQGKMSKLVLEDERLGKIAQDYIRSQFSPFAGLTTDLLLGRDYAERPLPRAGFGLLPGSTYIPKRLRMHGVTTPYSWKEYASQQFTPIPISEGVREVWKYGLGMSDKQIEQYAKSAAVILSMAGTGARITEDKNIEQPQ